MMADDEFKRLVTLYLEDAIDESGRELLNLGLAESAQRVKQFNDLRLLVGLIHEHGRTMVESPAVLGVPKVESARSWQRPWMAAAALLLLGLLLGSLITGWDRTSPSSSDGSRQLTSVGVSNGSFERANPALVTGHPKGAGHWAGDGVGLISQGEQGIQPFDGNVMLQFLPSSEIAPAPFPEPQRTTRWQIVDLSKVDIGTGNAVATLSARFNRGNGSKHGDLPCRVELYSFRGAIAGAEKQLESEEYLTAAVQNLVTDTDTQTWETVEATLLFPRQASYLLLGISGFGSRVDAPDGGEKFSGHYADDVELSLFEIPDTARP